MPPDFSKSPQFSTEKLPVFTYTNLILTQSFKPSPSQGIWHLIPKSPGPALIPTWHQYCQSSQNCGCVASYTPLVPKTFCCSLWLTAGARWVLTFGSKSGPVLAFSEDFKIQDAEDCYQNVPEQQTGERIGRYFSKNTNSLEWQPKKGNKPGATVKRLKLDHWWLLLPKGPELRRPDFVLSWLYIHCSQWEIWITILQFRNGKLSEGWIPFRSSLISPLILPLPFLYVKLKPLCFLH